MCEYQRSDRKHESLLLPLGAEDRLKSILPDSPPITKQEALKQEYFERTREIISQPSKRCSATGEVQS